LGENEERGRSFEIDRGDLEEGTAASLLKLPTEDCGMKRERPGLEDPMRSLP